MATNVEMKARPRHTSALDKYYMEVCPDCPLSGEQCQAGSIQEVTCILADVREILLRIEAKTRGSGIDGA